MNLIGRGNVVLPGGAHPVGVGNFQGNHPGGGGNPAQRAAVARRDHDGDLPGKRGNGHRPAGLDARTIKTARSANDQQFVAGLRQYAAIIFKIGPNNLVVVRRLWDDVRHVEHQVIVRNIVGAVARRAHVAAVEAGTGVVGGGHLVKAGGKRCVGDEIRGASAGAEVAGGQVPARPVGFAQSIAVINGLHRALNQVMIVIVRVGGGAAGVAQLHLLCGVNDGSCLRDGGGQSQCAHQDQNQISCGALENGFFQLEGRLDFLRSFKKNDRVAFP